MGSFLHLLFPPLFLTVLGYDSLRGIDTPAALSVSRAHPAADLFTPKPCIILFVLGALLSVQLLTEPSSSTVPRELVQ